MAGPVGEGAGRGDGPRPHHRHLLHVDDVPVSVRGPPARRARAQLHPGRRALPLPADEGPPGVQPHGLGRLRAAGRERGDQARGPPEGLDAREHRPDEGPVPALGHPLRLVEGDRLLHAGVLPLEPVAVPEDAREGAGLPPPRAGQLVPELPDGAGQRAGGRRRLRALLDPGGAEGARAVVLPHHRLRRAPARRPRPAGGLVGQGQGDAAQLDRPLRGRRDRLRDPRRRGEADRLHHPAGHDPRRHLHGAGAGAPAGARADRGAPGAGRDPGSGSSGCATPPGSSGKGRRAPRRVATPDGSPINPATGEEIPIWLANYVLPEYGSGAIMAVPAHDARDLEMARQEGLPVRLVYHAEDAPDDGATAGRADHRRRRHRGRRSPVRRHEGRPGDDPRLHRLAGPRRVGAGPR